MGEPTPPGTHSVEDQRAVTRYWDRQLFQQTLLLPASTARPVVVIWQPGNMRRDLGPPGTHKLLHISQEMAKEAGLPGICFIAMKWPEAAVDAQAVETLKADGFSMTSIYHYMGTATARRPIPPATTSALSRNRARNSGTGTTKPASCPSCRIFPPDGTIFPGTSTAAPRSRTGRRSCSGRSAATPGASRTGPASGRLVLAPLNEWGEGSYAEPNREYKFKMYEAVRDAFATPPSGRLAAQLRSRGSRSGPVPARSRRSLRAASRRAEENRTFSPVPDVFHIKSAQNKK